MNPQKREFIIHTGRIFTGLQNQPWAEAVGIQDQCIAHVGSLDQVQTALPRATVVSLPGCLATPGLVDAHCHFLSFGLFLMNVDLSRLPDLEACREKIRAAAGDLAPGQWLLGRGWNHHQWPDNGPEPGKKDLDDILPDNPAMMIRSCGHSVWVNSSALRAAGITAASPDPPGGLIVRDSKGEPTGLLKEARHLIMAHVPPPAFESLKKAALAAQKKALAAGLAGVHTCESLTEYEAFAALEKEGKLKIRIHHLLPPQDLEKAVAAGLKPGTGSARLWVGHQKLFADGSLGSGTALMKEPYADEPGNRGLAFFDTDQLKESITKGYALGFSTAVHAIGDQAVKNALDAIAFCRKTHPGPWWDRLEHIQLYDPADLPGYKAMDITASVQPAFVPTDWDIAERRWGAARLPYSYAWKNLLDFGLKVMFGSDAPVEPIAPILGLRAAVLRQGTDLKPAGGWRPDQRLTLEQSLTGFTKIAAWSAGKEDRSGSLRPGNWADITVFDRDLTQTPAETWHEIPVRMTVIDGEIVHQI